MIVTFIDRRDVTLHLTDEEALQMVVHLTSVLEKRATQVNEGRPFVFGYTFSDSVQLTIDRGKSKPGVFAVSIGD